ncbi:MAG: tetratricopeptide repeat protein, partial [Myxococcota bacterium]|nr:tetratricopeptide repeat protein [Myxococcota bacterium]
MLLLFLYFFCGIVFAESRIAVLEFRGVKINNEMLLSLSDQTRKAALEVLPTKDYSVMTRENIFSLLEDMGKDSSCIQGECEVDLGRNIGADLIITGNLIRFNKTYSLTLKLFLTSTGTVISIKEIESNDLLEMKHQTFFQSKSLLVEGLKLQSASKEFIKAAIPSNPKKAFKYFLRNCKEGNQDACLEVGYRYRDGTGVGRSTKKMLSYFEKACDNGHKIGCNDLGQYYREYDFWGNIRDLAFSNQLFDKSCQLGHGKACYRSGDYSSGCALNDFESCIFLGNKYVNDSPPKLEKALSAVKKALQLKSDISNRYIGNIAEVYLITGKAFTKGTGGVPEDTARGYEILAETCALKANYRRSQIGEACFYLADYFCVQKGNIKKANRLYEDSCSQDYKC